MSRLFYFAFLLAFITFVRCQKNQIPTLERVQDKFDQTRKGHLFKIDECFSLFLQGVELKYDDIKLKVEELTNLTPIAGSCPIARKKDQDDKKDDGKDVDMVEEAFIKFSYKVADKVGGLDLTEIQIEIKTLKDVTYSSWSVSEVYVSGKTSKSDKFEQVKLNYDALEIPSNNSFSCSGFELTKSFKNAKPDKDDAFIKKFQRLTIKDLQIQPFDFKNDEFHDSFNCSTWFTIGTFAGLIILILFTSILAFGLLYIMTIKTNDRFEDPKGKPLNVGQIDG